MEYGTGTTIYETVMSIDSNNVPVTGATFTATVVKDGSVFTGVTPTVSLQHAATGTFVASWSGSATGNYQISYKNSITSTVYVTNIYQIKEDADLGPTIYVGL